MKQIVLPGLNQNIDTLEFSGSFLFTQNIESVRITRHVDGGKLVAVFPSAALYDPWPSEYLWTRITLLGVVPAWHSIHRSYRIPGMVECVYQTADQYQSMQTVVPELVTDPEAWRMYRQHSLREFLCHYQEALDKRAAEPAGIVED